MAKKSYSPEAIQARQQRELDAYNAAKEEAKNVEERPKQGATAAPASAAPITPLTTPKVSSIENPKKPLPYLAYNQTTDGLAYYGTGFKGWLRRTWADLTSPDKFKWQVNQLDIETQERVNSTYDKRVDAFSKMLDEKVKWNEWGAKTFGLSSQELAALPAGMMTELDISTEASKAEGDTEAQTFAKNVGTGFARAVRFTRDSTQNMIWGGLELIGIDDTLVRKINATAIGIDAVADRFAKDEAKNIFTKLTQTGGIAVGKDVFTVAQALLQGKISWDEVTDTVSDYQKASAMAYTLMFDEARRAEFEKALAEGKDPGFLAQEYGKLSTEFFGSVLGSPSTFMGLSLVKPVNLFNKTSALTADTVRVFNKTITLPWKTVGKLPTFGEFIGAGRGKFLGDSTKRFFNNTLPELDTLLRNAGDIKSERRAQEIIEKSIGVIKKEFDDNWNQKNWMYNLASVDNDGKVRRIAADSDYIVKAMLTRYGVNETLATLQDMVNLRRGGPVSVDAARKLLAKSDMVFSDAGRMLGEVLYRMEGSDILSAIKKSKSHKGTFTAITEAITRTVDDLIPSVPDLLAAEKKLKAGDTSERVLKMAQMASELPTPVRVIFSATRPSEFLSKKTTAGMAQLFMNWMPRSWMRSIWSNITLTALATDFKTALTSTVDAFAGITRKTTKPVLEGITDAITKRIGFVPAETDLGVKSVFGERKGFLGAMQSSDMITGARIILKVVDDEIQKALPAVVKDMPEWDALVSLFPADQKGLMFTALKRASGNVDEALDLLRTISGGGDVEVWRLAEPTVDMRNHLTALGMMDEFYELQRNAPDMETFKSAVDAMVLKYDDLVTKAAQKLPSRGNLPEEMYEFATDLADNNKVDARDRDLFTELLTAWDNTSQGLKSVTEDVMMRARRVALENPQLHVFTETADQKINQAVSITSEMYRSVDALRTGIRKMDDFLKDRNNRDLASLKAMWKKPIHYKGHTFKLSDIYPNQEISKLDYDTFKNRMWTAFFETTGEAYRNAQEMKYTRTMDALEEMLAGMGTTLEDFAKTDQGGDNPYRLLSEMYREAEDIEDAMSWRRFLRQFNYEKTPLNPDGTPVLLKDTMGDWQAIFPKWEGGKRHIVNAVAKDTGKAIPYEEITLEQAWRSVWNRTRVPPFDGDLNEPRILWETREGFLADVERWRDKVISEWGVTVKSTLVDQTEELRKFRSAYEERIAPVREAAGRLAVETRNFVLHDYDKTYFDHSLSYLFGNSFHYWTTRTYAKSLMNIVDSPRTANIYMAYKEKAEREHADMPEFYRRNVEITNLFGIDLASPYYVNLESMINPIYGLTGVDFNDPKKRVDWFTNMISDAGSSGISFSPLMNWAIALKMYSDGQTEAGERWLGRLAPQSQLIKSASSTLFGEAIELDPFVQIANNDLWGGVDSYERNRVVAALAMMVQNGEISQEEMIEIARTKQGAAWDRAVALSGQQRFTGDMASFFLGAGTRPRTEADMRIEKFWNDYSVLLASKSTMTPDEYREAWNKMRENPEYGMFMDGLLLGRKNKAEIESAYAFNVLSRIPPGSTTDITKLLDFDPQWIEEFYNAKGDIAKMNLTEQDKARFMAGIEDMGFMYALPSNANRRDWTQARSMYTQMKDKMVERYGEDIHDLIQGYYDQPDFSAKEDYLDDNPIVRDALILQDYYITSTPQLNTYYGGFDTHERYLVNIMYRDLEIEFGEDMRNLDLQYGSLLTKEERKQFEKNHPGFKEYLKAKKEAWKEVDEQMSRIPFFLPEAPAVREEAQSAYQEALQQAATMPVMPMEFWQESLGPELTELMALSIEEGEKMDYYAQQELEYQARRLGMDANEAMAYFRMTLAQP